METVPTTIHDAPPSNVNLCTSPFTHRDQLLQELAETRNFIQVEELERWLPRPPPVTTIRVNLLKCSVAQVKDLVQTASLTQYGTRDVAKFVTHPDLPELLGIAPLPSPVIYNPEGGQPLREIVVDVNCGASILRGAHIFAPGVLAMTKSSREGDLADVFVDLEGKCKKGTDLFQSQRKLLIGRGRIVQPRFKLYGNGISPTGIAVQMLSNISNVPCLGDSYLTPSTGMLQNLPSMVAVRALSPMPGETILDMCASPGNKTSHIVELMKDSGTVIALDKSAQKMIPLQKKLEEYQSVKWYAQDSTKCVDCTGGHDPSVGPPPFRPESFDRVLLDSPCSALGNRPQLANHITAKMLHSFPVQQKQLFFAAVAALRPGGVLVYSTCSINQHENELMIVWALNKFPQLELLPIHLKFGGPGWPTDGLTEGQRHMVRRFGPPSQTNILDDAVGFFIAKMTKRP